MASLRPRCSQAGLPALPRSRAASASALGALPLGLNGLEAGLLLGREHRPYVGIDARLLHGHLGFGIRDRLRRRANEPLVHRHRSHGGALGLPRGAEPSLRLTQ